MVLQRTYMYGPWTRTKGRENAGGRGGVGWRGIKGRENETTVIA